MSQLLGRGASWLKDKLQAGTPPTVSYRRGATTITGVMFTLGDKLRRLTDDLGGTRTEHSGRDYIIAADQILIASVRVDPEVGDQIIDANDPDGTTRTWEVRSPGGDEAAWRPLDPQRHQFRIHCELVAD